MSQGNKVHDKKAASNNRKKVRDVTLCLGVTTTRIEPDVLGVSAQVFDCDEIDVSG